MFYPAKIFSPSIITNLKQVVFIINIDFKDSKKHFNLGFSDGVIFITNKIFF